MPEPRLTATVRARSLGTLAGAPRRPAYDYGYRGWELDPIPGEKTPRQIVAELHAEIAAKSPGHAVLVSMFSRLCSAPPSWDPEDDIAVTPVRAIAGPSARRGRWRELRLSGVSADEARIELGVSKRTAVRYENWLAGLGSAA